MNTHGHSYTSGNFFKFQVQQFCFQVLLLFPESHIINIDIVIAVEFIQSQVKKIKENQMKFVLSLIIVLIELSAIFVSVESRRLSEQERVALWQQKNVWPPNWQPETPAMKKVLAEREQEIMSLKHADERWENWLQFTQNRLVPKFTTHGFEVISTPAHVRDKLFNAVNRSLQNFDNIPDEGNIDVIYHPGHLQPKFVNIGNLAREVGQDLKELHEQWSGVELVHTSAYGVRFYQNGSSLVMHYDKVCLLFIMKPCI